MSRSAPLVLVHGNPETAAIWNPFLRLLGRDDVVTLSPPGFGAPVPPSFDPSVQAYREWLAARLAVFSRPVDLVGHDWGGVHVAQVAMHHPHLIRSWASDALGVLAPGFVWHSMARIWQTPEAGEESVRQLFGGDLDRRRQVVAGLGITGDAGEAVAAAIGPEMGRAVLSLLRSAAQPAMSRFGEDLGKARAAPGLALIAAEDTDRSNGTPEQHRWAAERAGAQAVVLDGAPHWWPSENPGPAAEALTRFWRTLEDQ
ncbi:alpha/beta fold hydrolase [Streptomyces beigongshangae]|uniref:alpha/beta fold hydrolase n=1 Tax=Streptomyces beigongshangae TaxID=2841597 RepID=UPI001C8604C1|nr:alpha/beta hydrolase [Streptomyces sp. REN17]